MATPLHITFAESVQAQRNDDQPREALIHSRNGLAALWSKSTLAEANKSIGQESQAEQDFREQAQVWDLIAKIDSIREGEVTTGPNPHELLERNQYLAPKSLVNAIRASDTTLQEWQLIKTNLEAFSQNSDPSSSTSSPRRIKSTYRHETLQEARRLKNLGRSGADNAATSLDLDASIRPGGVRGAGGLVGKDKSLEQKTVTKVYECVRSGRLDEAERYCEEHDESWRIASIHGGQAWGIEAEEGDVDMDNGLPEPRVTGNVRRDLWKKTCRAIASNSALSTHERALYAALVGDLENTLPACTSWTDHLWAHLNAKIATRLDAKLNQLGGFWHDRYGSEVEGVAGTASGDPMKQLADVFHQIESAPNTDDLLRSQDWYTKTMKAVILGNAETVIDDFVEYSADIQVEDEISWATLNFFMTHFALYRRSAGLPVNDDSVTYLLESYINQLGELAKADTLVAIYSAELDGGDREQAYANYLEQLAVSGDLSFEDKQAALEKAQEQGLDVVKIANILASRVGDIIDYTIKEILIAHHAFPKVQFGDANRRVKGINQSIEWLLATDETFMDVVKIVNKYTRYYFVSDNPDLAAALLENLPEDFMNTFHNALDPTETALEPNELDHLREMRMNFKVVRVLEVLSRGEEIWESGRKEFERIGKSQQMIWSNENAVHVDRAYDAVLSLVKNDQAAENEDMTFMDYVPSADDRARLRVVGFKRVKRMVLGDVVLRIHDLLRLSDLHLTRNLQRSIDLCTIIVDPELEVHETITKADYDVLESEAGEPEVLWLDEYLSRVKESVLEGYRRGGTKGFEV